MAFKKDGHQTPRNVTRHPVAHVTFEVRENDHGGNTFALVAGDAAQAKDRKPFFTGFIEADMANQLRDLAKKIDQLAEKKRMATT